MKKLKEAKIAKKGKEKGFELNDKKAKRKRLLSKIGKIILIVIILYLVVIEILGIIRRSKISTISTYESCKRDKDENSVVPAVIQVLYETKHYYYFLGQGSCIYTVYYKDGTEESLADAFTNKKVTRGDLLRYGIYVGKARKY